jgi:hypothetical protein
MENQHRRITGYRELDQAEIELMNQIKAKAAEVGDLVNRIGAHANDPDRRWLSIGTTHLQQGFMALTRAVAQPTTF